MLDAISGKIDFQDRHIDSLPNKPTLVQNAQKGGYRLVELELLAVQPVPDLPQYHPQRPEDAGDVRQQGLPQSAVARHQPQGDHRHRLSRPVRALPGRTAPEAIPGSTRNIARQFTDHNVKEANAILDGLGYKRDAQGARLRPDGQKVFFAIDVIPTLYPDLVDTLELVKRHWAELGVDMKVNTLERALYYTRADNNDHDARSGRAPAVSIRCSTRATTSPSIRRARATRSRGRSGTSRAARTARSRRSIQKKRMKLFDDARATSDLKKRGEIMKQIFDIAAEDFETVGVCLAVTTFGVVKNNLENVPKKMPAAWMWPNPGPVLPQQYFFRT